MIARFFKKKNTSASSRKATKGTTAPPVAKHTRVLTAEGWKRIMMKTLKPKKS